MFYRWWNRLTWLAAIIACALIAWNSLPYFSGDSSVPFLAERPELTSGRLWRALLITHVTGGIACLAFGPVLVWNLALKKSPRLHRWLGWGYVLAVLGWAGPTGLVLSFTAKGGGWGVSGFFVTGVLWLATTGWGLRAIQRREVGRHAEWMARSYALALSAIFFRAIHVVLYAVGVSHQANYVMSLWLSLLVSLVIGESFVGQLRRHQRIRSLSLFLTLPHSILNNRNGVTR